jgi:hypothetical protein
MSVLSEEQEVFLRQVDATNLAASACGDEYRRDLDAVIGIEVATCLSTYHIGGDQFAAVVMDLMASLSRTVVLKDPVLADRAGVNWFISGATALCALAFRQYEETQRGS